MRGRLVELLRELSYQRKKVILASGRESDFYVDGRQTTLNAEGSWLVGNLVLDALKPEVDGVGGLVVGADPIAAATAAVSFHRDRPVHAFLVRKQAKGHGMKKHVEGRKSLPDGSKVCVVEDTCTTGGSMLRAIELCQAEGLEVVQCLTIVDRNEGAVERLADAGYTLETLVTRAELEG
ncbi:MAG: orotate phosphoribosyltransferase [Proteobacteria bacterium]|nr:orotate phosphoribosyltransferase [Pseudomonadota bacterium]MCP4916887.1 orotate phosphoribosyltransferase [Pseudomonadota bacterium]